MQLVMLWPAIEIMAMMCNYTLISKQQTHNGIVIYQKGNTGSQRYRTYKENKILLPAFGSLSSLGQAIACRHWITWSNTGASSIGPFETILNEILNENQSL